MKLTKTKLTLGAISGIRRICKFVAKAKAERAEVTKSGALVLHYKDGQKVVYSINDQLSALEAMK